MGYTDPFEQPFGTNWLVLSYNIGYTPFRKDGLLVKFLSHTLYTLANNILPYPPLWKSGD